MKSLIISPLEEKHLGEVVRIHKDVLGYTFNSLLGYEHVSFMYRIMSQFDDSYVGVAIYKDQAVGVISGALDMDKIKSRFMKTFKPRQWMNLALRVICRPSLMSEWWMGNVIGRVLYFDGKKIQPCLTTIAVDSRFQGMGIGRRLVNGLEAFFSHNGVCCYRLDTLASNHNAREFYRNLGFHQAETRANSVLYIKTIVHE